MLRYGRAFAVCCVAAVVLSATACTTSASTDNIAVGDCVGLDGADRQAPMTKQPCNGDKANFKVIAKTPSPAQCPSDVDTSYAVRHEFGSNGQALCLDINWVIGGCMDVPDTSTADAVRVDCADPKVQDKKRAIQILKGVASIDSCSTALGYPYVDRNFTVCVEEVQ